MSAGGARVLGAGVVGLGFMGRTHAAAYESASAAGLPCRLVGVCDTDASRVEAARAGAPAASGNLATGVARGAGARADVAGYTDWRAMLADPRIHILSVCTHTDTHAQIAVAALQAGKHVLVEKPVAVRGEEIRQVAAAARRAGRLAMPGMVMRFWPGWPWLRERIRDGSLGALRSLSFERRGAVPGWSPEFYRNPARTGGALVDLHVHDADAVLWMLGMPDEVVTTGTIDHVTTIYRFAGGPAHVVAEGGLDHADGFPFRIRYVACFDGGTAEFDLTRTPNLVVWRGGAGEPVAPGDVGPYDAEVRYFVGAVAAGRRLEDLTATIDDAAEVADLLDAERRSLESGRPVTVRVQPGRRNGSGRDRN